MILRLPTCVCSRALVFGFGITPAEIGVNLCQAAFMTLKLVVV